MRGLVLISLIAVIIILGCKVYEDETALGKLRFELTDCKCKLNNTSKELKTLRFKIDKILKEKTKVENRIDVLSEEIRSIKSQNKKLKSLIERLSFKRSVRYYAVGVDENGRGRVVEFRVTLRNGNGSIFINVTNVLLNVETQRSIITAKAVAENLTGKTFNRYDIYITFVNFEKKMLVIVGPSAGSAFALSMVALLENKSLRGDVLITGTVRGDGSIGMIGEVYKKGVAAKRFGAKIFLVPKGQRVKIEGLKVVEVGNVRQALRYVLKP